MCTCSLIVDLSPSSYVCMQAAGEGMTLGHLAHTLSQGEGIPLKMLPARELSKMKPRNSESSLSSCKYISHKLMIICM